MKKLIIAMVVGAMAFMSFADTEVVTNVYDLSMSLKVPYLKNGVRNYAGQKLKGEMYVVYEEDEIVNAFAEVTNTSTKVAHSLDLTSGFYYLMGKESKKSARTVPTVFFQGQDYEVLATMYEAHEKISYIALAGTGKLNSIKSVTTGCGVCGEPVSLTQYCNLLWSMSGNVVGVMDCECPDEEDGWSHTLKTVLCGVYYDEDDQVERSHDASFYGTWSAKFNKKLSDTKVK